MERVKVILGLVVLVVLVAVLSINVKAEEPIWLDNGNPWEHILNGGADTEGHTFVDGACMDCGHVCIHEYENGACKYCNSEPEPQPEPCQHLNTEWRYVGNDLHSTFCLDCGTQLKVAGYLNYNCSYENGVCISCGHECEHLETHPDSSIESHYDVCNKCKAHLNEEKHTYVDGICTVCGHECEHYGSESKYDDACHWKVCKFCGYETEHEEHSFDLFVGIHGGKCKKCDYTKSVPSPDRPKPQPDPGTFVPNTGDDTVWVVLGISVIIVLGTVLVVKKRK